MYVTNYKDGQSSYEEEHLMEDKQYYLLYIIIL